MGRYYYSKKEEADGLKRIQTWWLKKYGYFQSGWKTGGIKWANSWSGQESNISLNVNILGENNYLQLFYTQTDSNGGKQDFNYKVPLTTTPCYFGGVRYWFLCSASRNGAYCGKRVAVLYKGGAYFACRHCYNLSYESRNENRRYKDFGLFYILGNLKKREELEAKIKRRFYKGKPTRKLRALHKMSDRESVYELDIYKKELLTK